MEAVGLLPYFGRFGIILSICFFFFNDPATTEIYTLSLHDALPIREHARDHVELRVGTQQVVHLPHVGVLRSEEHTSELQSPDHLVCRLLLEKKNDDPHLADPPRANIPPRPPEGLRLPAHLPCQCSQ